MLCILHINISIIYALLVQVGTACCHILQKKRKKNNTFLFRKYVNSLLILLRTMLPGMNPTINSKIYNSMQGIVGLETNHGTLHIQVSILCLYNRARIS